MSVGTSAVAGHTKDAHAWTNTIAQMFEPRHCGRGGMRDLDVALRRARSCGAESVHGLVRIMVGRRHDHAGQRIADGSDAARTIQHAAAAMSFHCRCVVPGTATTSPSGQCQLSRRSAIGQLARDDKGRVRTVHRQRARRLHQGQGRRGQFHGLRLSSRRMAKDNRFRCARRAVNFRTLRCPSGADNRAASDRGP